MVERYGSDVVVEALGALGIEYASMNPGASYRGLHDSLVHAGRPELITTLFEGVALAIAHGYAKAAGKPMAALIHNLVGLQHASLGIYNAWADQVPVMVIGGSGPADAASRRPWIDWVHTARDQSALVREFTKWTDQPSSLAALPEALSRAHRFALSVPQGPTYLALDTLLQEAVAPETDLRVSDARPPGTVTCPPAELEQIADVLAAAEYPVIVTDATGRSERAYEGLITLAEVLAAPVVDLGARHSFPNTHWADRTEDRSGQLAQADAVLVLDARDVRYAVSRTGHEGHTARPLTRPDAKLLVLGLNELAPSGFIDREAHVTADVIATADTAVALPALTDILRPRARVWAGRRRRLEEQSGPASAPTGAAELPADAAISEQSLAQAVWDVIGEHEWQCAHGRLHGWVRRSWRMDRYNCHLGYSGGAGLGYGIGAAIGAALAHRSDDTLVVSLQPDGDLLYTPSGLWTAAHHRLPMLVVVANNRTYGQDRMHQRLIAESRGRLGASVSAGIDIDDPAIDISALARAQGVEGIGPITTLGELRRVLPQAVDAVTAQRRPILIDAVLER